MADRYPETVENTVSGYFLFLRVVQTFFIFELLIYPQVISIIDVIAQNGSCEVEAVGK